MTADISHDAETRQRGLKAAFRCGLVG